MDTKLDIHSHLGISMWPMHVDSDVELRVFGP
jgi:hypothetical protein